MLHLFKRNFWFNCNALLKSHFQYVIYTWKHEISSVLIKQLKFFAIAPISPEQVLYPSTIAEFK